MNTTRLPHIEGFEGAVIVSEGNFPAPVLSPIKSDFMEKIEVLAARTNLKVLRFSDLDAFCEVIDGLKTYDPWMLEMPGA
jgi:CRISPR-associated protein Cst2